jgi:hypoxanthine phosphoribosyltransferase
MKKEVVRKLISKNKIDKRISQISKLISKDYKNKKPFFICLLKGAWVFSADLLRKVKIPVLIDFLTVSSYADQTITTGKINIESRLSSSVRGRDILIIEDIVDTGLTIKKIKKYLLTKKPRSIKVCALLDKPMRRKIKVKLDYVGFRVPDKFIVGYGIDYANKYRNLPYIGYVEFL